jgi:hypothetical protein
MKTDMRTVATMVIGFTSASKRQIFEEKVRKTGSR